MPQFCGMLAQLAKWANSIRSLFDALEKRIDSFGVVAVLGGITAATARLMRWAEPEVCRALPVRVIDLELPFSARRFAALLGAIRDNECGQAFLRSLVTTDILFPAAYALLLCAIFIWVERQRRVGPTKAPIDDAVPNRNHILLLLPLVAGAADIFLENIPLWVAGRLITAHPSAAQSDAVNAIVVFGSLGASLKWSLVFLSIAAILGEFLYGSRGLVIRRLRYSVLAVLIGALPLLIVPQGQDILQRTIEGTTALPGIVRGLIALTFGAYVVWYCGRKLVQLDFPETASGARDDWNDFYGEHIPRILGITVLALGAAAFARAGAALPSFAAFAIGGFIVAAAIKKFFPRVTEGIGRVVIRGYLRLVDGLDHDVARAFIAMVVALGFLYAPHQPRDFVLLRRAAYLLLMIAWLFYLYVYSRRGVMAAREIVKERPPEEQEKIKYRAKLTRLDNEAVASLNPSKLDRAIKLTLVLGVVISVISLAAFTFRPVVSARWLGTLMVLSMAVGSVVFVGSIATWVHERHGIPIAPIALALAALFSVWNDAHVVRRFTGTQDRIAGRKEIANRYDLWKRDTASHQVVLVAAAGGGLRAAYWTAMSLAALQDSIPDFNRHLFAVSSVSGGSVGASVYAALVHDSASSPAKVKCLRKNGRSSYSNCVRSFMAEDFLSPVLAKMVGPDFVQAFLPFPWRKLDRSLGLETSWEDSYEKVIGLPTLDSGFVHLYSDSLAPSTVPLLFLNTTHVETGKRYITAPLKLSMHDSQDLLGLMQSDMPLSTAAHNSARFTYVSPPGRIQRGDVELGHVVDGGYFENSGLATLREILDIIQSRDSAAKPVVIYLCNDPVPCKPARRGVPVMPRSAVIDWLGPIKALLSTRDARGSLSRADVAGLSKAKFYQLSVCDSLVAHNAVFPDSAKLGSVERDKQGQDRVISPPLGWLLSKVARDWMDSSFVADTASLTASACRKTNAANVDSIRTALKQD